MTNQRERELNFDDREVEELRGALKLAKEALKLAWRDIFDWEATAEGLRKQFGDNHPEKVPSPYGIKESEKVRVKIHKALVALQRTEKLGEGLK